MLLSLLYRLATDLGAPVISFYLRRRLTAGREDAARFQERLGFPSALRPEGRLIWCHAASVGEAVSLLPLVERLRAVHPDNGILVTTGTVTSARLLADRLPPQVIHQYVPVDRRTYVERFMTYWRPDLVLWVESELWPNLLASIRRRSLPAVLLNARMSDRSLRNWLRFRGWIRELLSTFQLCLTPSEDEKNRFTLLGADNVICVGNLKYAARTLPCDTAMVDDLRRAIMGRPVWSIVSTHEGEENMAVQAHKDLSLKYPDLLTIIVPRHAVRGNEVAALIRAAALPFAQRSQHQPILQGTAVYLADTMGELGLFYRLAPISVIGGSLVPHGGHNPVEAAQLGSAIIFGKYMHNFSVIAEEFRTAHAAKVLAHASELPEALDDLLSAPQERMQMIEAARQIVMEKNTVLDQVMQRLDPWLLTEQRRVA